jgi:hypothetical protein
VALSQTAVLIRTALDALDQKPKFRSSDNNWEALPAEVHRELAFDVFFPTASRNASGKSPGAQTPALMQILGPLPGAFRVELVKRFDSYPADDDAVADAIVRLALFDPAADVRKAAIQALERQPVEKYGPKLVAGFRHPSPEVAEHAADAVAALKKIALLPRLVDLLDEPDPTAPFDRDEEGTKTPAIREVVKVNHLRNCLLCHAPIAPPRTEIRAGSEVPASPGLMAPIPFPDEPLPPTTVAYYQSFRPIDMLVRVNDVYLRQDFSRMEKVANPGKWPAEQRFDYLVRTRTMSPEEAAKASAKTSDEMPSPHRRAALSALARVTQTFLGTRSSDWREEIAWRIEEENASRR